MQYSGTTGFNQDLDSLFAGLKNEHHVLIAVSGGSDSIALLHLFHQWAMNCGRPKLTVATIDHGLRMESAAEARHVAKICAGLGIPHIIETWSGQKPQSGVSEKAREARYALLSVAAKKAGASAIVLGHTMDDQRETVLMRVLRAGAVDMAARPDRTTSRGLAGMRIIGNYCGPPYFGPVKLLRPLLAVGRQELRNYLTTRGISWIDDPGNEDLKYERIRIRQRADESDARDFSAQEVCQYADLVAIQRQENSLKCAELISCKTRFGLAGVLEADADAFASGPDEAVLLLRVMIAVAGGRTYLIPQAAAIDLVSYLQKSETVKRSVGSAIIERKGSLVRFWRENRNLPRMKLNASSPQTIAWDGRIVYRYEDYHLDQELLMAPLGSEGVRHIERCSRIRLKGMPRAALHTQPALFRDGKPVFVPFQPWQEVGFTPPEIFSWTPAVELFRSGCDEEIVRAIADRRKA